MPGSFRCDPSAIVGLSASLPQRSKLNTVLNIVPQGSVHCVERLGRFAGMREAGWYLAVPFIDSVAYVIDTREQTIQIEPSVCVTQDNVSVHLDGVVFVQVVDPYKAAYGATEPFKAVAQHAQSVMRTAIGQRTLDEAFHDRVRLNQDIQTGIASSAENWGLVVKRYEVLEIQPDFAVAKAMDLQATAERRRREKVTTAEAEKRAAVLEAEGAAEATERAAEADKRSVVLQAEAQAESVRLAAHAARESVVLAAQAEAEALASVGQVLSGDDGVKAAGVQLARDYMRMMGEGMSKSNTLMIGGPGSSAGGGTAGAGAGGGGILGGFDEALARAVVLAATASKAIGEGPSAAASSARREGPSPEAAVAPRGSGPTMPPKQAARPTASDRVADQRRRARISSAADSDAMDQVLRDARQEVDNAMKAKEAAISRAARPSGKSE